MRARGRGELRQEIVSWDTARLHSSGLVLGPCVPVSASISGMGAQGHSSQSTTDQGPGAQGRGDEGRPSASCPPGLGSVESYLGGAGCAPVGVPLPWLGGHVDQDSSVLGLVTPLQFPAPAPHQGQGGDG